MLWNDTTNIQWKCPIPGIGLGTPIVVGELLYLTSVIELDPSSVNPTLQFMIYAINRKSGEIQWQKMLNEDKAHTQVIHFSSYAVAACATDGKHLIAFMGSYGLYCLDLNGNMIWQKDLGIMSDPMSLGEAIPPVIYKDKLIIVRDHAGQSDIQVMDVKTGNLIWKKDRNEENNFATPLVIEEKNNTHLIVPGYSESISYNIENGEKLWSIKESGKSSSIIITPVYENGILVIVTSRFDDESMHALDLRKIDAGADPMDALLWKKTRLLPYISTPQLYNGKIYYVRASRVLLTCADLKTGEIHYAGTRPRRLLNIYASPIVVNDNLYIIDRRGNCAIIKTGEKFELLASNKLNDFFDASPVLVENQLILRGHKAVYCVSE
tara:strand:- start:1481 stop:2620 length:1140 start_codon:yes stop_codon:yes gene_type:complete